MFTGIIEETGTIQKIQLSPGSIKLVVQAGLPFRALRVGESLAVNGCCLTVGKIFTRYRQTLVQFDLLRETWERTNLRAVKSGSLVNLERALPLDGRLSGHFVTGHIDGTGTIIRWERAGQDHVLEIGAQANLMRYVVFKGSIAVDGISLTIAALRKKSFRIWVIPHTYEVTALRERTVGDAVNLETDLLGKYVERFVTSWKNR